jgi:ABC-type glycerol-3-phosphate transport system permease component
VKSLRTFFIYTALVLGGVIFAWPFLWMASTSVKLDREMYGEKVHLWASAPVPESVSPYVDTRYYRDVSGPRMEEAVAFIEADLNAISYPWPPDVDRATLIHTCATGVYKILCDSQPPAVWSLPSQQLKAALQQQVTPALAGETVDQVRRSFCLGALRIKSYDLQEQLLVDGTAVAATWQQAAAGHVRLVQQPGKKPDAEVHYDLTQGDSFELSHTFATSFPVDRLHHIQLSLRDDDSWNRLTLYIEKQGHLYKAERSHYMADNLWSLVFWQEPGPDDQTTNKIHNWLLLRQVDSGPQYESDPCKLRIRIQVVRAGLLGAWAEKIWRNYGRTLEYVPFWRYVATSVFIVMLSLIGTLFSCSLVAYSFARLQWPGRNFCFALMLATMMIPGQVTMIPYFLIVRTLGWYNTLYPLWVGHFFAAAFNVFLLRQFLQGIPRDLEDAAKIDGCGFWRIYWHIMLPLIRPTLAVIGIFTFMGAWNDFMGPLVYLSDQRLYPLSLGLYALSVSTGSSFGIVMAGSLLMTLPVVATFFFAQRYFLKGVALTGMKG